MKTKPVVDNLPLVIKGRYFFDMREGWNVFRVFEPVTYVKEKCFMCGGTGRADYTVNGECPICKGRGHDMAKKYPFHSLDNFIASLNLNSGSTVKVTVEVIHEPTKSVYLWDGQIKDGEELLKR